MLRWTERVIEAKARGSVTPEELREAQSCFSCLVWEAGQVLGLEYNQASAALERRGLDMPGGMFPMHLLFGHLDEAERLCLAVEDALQQIKREGGA